MSIAVTLRGVSYTLAQDGDQDYGAYMSQLINALVNETNNTPLSTNTVQYDYVVSTDATKRTHATLEAVIADVAVLAGSNVLVDGVSFTQTTTLDITKKLYIHGLGNSTFKAAAGLGTDPIIKFSADGILFNGFVLDADGNTPDYALEVDAGVMGCVINAEIKGVFGAGDIDNGSVDEAIAGVIKKDSGNYLLPISLIGANSALSNLASPTAINEDLVYDTDDTYDVGSDSIEIKTVWTREIKHKGASGNYTLEIATTDNDGDIELNPIGGGVVRIDSTIEIESSSIVEDTEDFTISASALGKDLNLNAVEDVNLNATNGDLNANVGGDVVLNAGSDTYTIDKGGNTLDIVGSKLIQDYTVVGSVGSANQQFAGRDYSIAELVARFGVGAVDAYYTFPATDLLNDQSANAYNLTGTNVTDADNTTGIMNTNYAVDLNGTDETMYENGTFWDAMPTAMCVNVWFYLTDGQPAAISTIAYKEGSAANHRFQLYVSTAGQVNFYTQVGGTSTYAISSTTFANAVATGWHMATFNWDTTNGKRLWIDGKLEAQDISQTILCTGGNTTNLYIGSNATPTEFWGGGNTGKLANLLFADYTLTQADVDFLYATTIPLPTALQGKDFAVRGRYKNLGVATDIRTFEPEITQIRTTDILLKPSIAWQAIDERRLVGEV